MTEPSGPTYEDSVGAQLLAAVLARTAVIKERHDTLEFLNHVYLRHSVRLVVAIDRLLGAGTRASLFTDPARHFSLATPLQTWYGRVVVPLGSLDRHSRATTHVTNESGDLVPLFTSNELNRMLGGGLVSFATRALSRPLPTDLELHLREVPWAASRRLHPAILDSQTATDEALESAKSALLAFSDGLELLMSMAFSHAFGVIAGSEQLVVALDISKGPIRLLSYCFERPLAVDSDVDDPPTPHGLRKYTRLLARFWDRAGTSNITIALGQIGGCDRYQLTADAPFDTWFQRATFTMGGTSAREPEEVDTSHVYRLFYAATSRSNESSGSLRVDLRSVFTGVARTSVYASAFLAACCLLGLVRVLLATDHAFLSDNTDAGAAVLLLFPGIAASLLASPARHTLTATVQFPLRFTLWCMCLGSFALATATAIRLSGYLNIGLWALISGFVGFGSYALRRRGREMVDS